MKEEIFKTVKGYEGQYEVSDLGRVKSLKRRNAGERILKGSIDFNGYTNVTLHKDRKQKSRTVHQLVAEAFLNHTPNGYKGLIVDHGDNNRLNNRLDNLFLRTARENTSKDKKGGTSIFTGVSWDKKSNKWRAEIRINVKRKYLGLFKCELKAAEAYNLALKQLNLS